MRRPFQPFNLSNQLERLGIVTSKLQPLAGQVKQRATVILVFDLQCKRAALLGDLPVLALSPASISLQRSVCRELRQLYSPGSAAGRHCEQMSLSFGSPILALSAERFTNCR